MSLILIILAIFVALLGIAGSVVPVLPGPPLSFVALLLTHWSGYAHFDTKFFVVWAIVVIAVTVLDYILPVWMTKRGGGSPSSTRGALLGLVLGMVLFPPWGIVVGPFLGALLGELIYNGQDKKKAFKVALQSFVAFILTTGAKLIVSGIIFYDVVKSLFA